MANKLIDVAKFDEEDNGAESCIIYELISVYESNVCVLLNERRPDFAKVKYKCLTNGQVLNVSETSVICGMKPDVKYIIYLNDISHGIIKSAIVLDEKQFENCLDKLDLDEAYKQSLSEMDFSLSMDVIDRYVIQHIQLNWHSQTKCELVTELRDQYLTIVGKRSDNLVFNEEKHVILVYIPKHLHTIIQTLFTVFAQRIKMSLSNEVTEIAYPDNSSKIRLVVGAGGNANELLLPTQTRTVEVKKLDYNVLSRDNVIGELERFGRICNVVENHIDSAVWGKVTYMDRCSAEAALTSKKLSTTFVLGPCSYRYSKNSTMTALLYSINTECIFCVYVNREQPAERKDVLLEVESFQHLLKEMLNTIIESESYTIEMHLPRQIDDQLKCVITIPEYEQLSSCVAALKESTLTTLKLESVHNKDQAIQPEFTITIQHVLYELMYDGIQKNTHSTQTWNKIYKTKSPYRYCSNIPISGCVWFRSC